MDWSNEEYVRLYTRETTDDLELSWEALALWRAMLCKFDRAGLMSARKGWRSVSLATRIPFDVVMRAGPELISDGRVVEIEGGFQAPNYIAAQTTSKSDKLRQKESRDRRAREAVPKVIDTTQARHESSHAVTSSHDESRNVTLCSALLCDSDPSALRHVVNPPVAPEAKTPSAGLREVIDKTNKAMGEVGEARAKKHRIPDDWRPNQTGIALARKLGRDVEAEAQHFREHHGGKGTTHLNWDLTFCTWLRNSRKWERGNAGQSSISPTLMQWANGDDK